MSGIEIKTFQEPDETVTFDHGHSDLVTVGALTIGRQELEPGWRWSTHVKPIAGTDRCEFHHISYVLAGRIGVESRDGEIREVTAAGICEASRKLGFEIRAGVHTGEVEVASGDLRGVAVHLAARIMNAAGPGEVFVSATSRELASGASVDFHDRGSQEFKGISGQRQIYEARHRAGTPQG